MPNEPPVDVSVNRSYVRFSLRCPRQSCNQLIRMGLGLLDPETARIAVDDDEEPRRRAYTTSQGTVTNTYSCCCEEHVVVMWQQYGVVEADASGVVDADASGVRTGIGADTADGSAPLRRSPRLRERRQSAAVITNPHRRALEVTLEAAERRRIQRRLRRRREERRRQRSVAESADSADELAQYPATPPRRRVERSAEWRNLRIYTSRAAREETKEAET